MKCPGWVLQIDTNTIGHEGDRMKVVVSGGTGFLGSALTKALVKKGYQVVVLTRDPSKTSEHGTSVTFVSWTDINEAVVNATAVINLAGEPLGGRRWTDSLKKKIISSRVEATSAIVKAINAAPIEQRPKVFVSASAVGFYGDSGDTVLTEESPAGDDFLAGVCRLWESHAHAAPKGVRVVTPRIGVVLHPDGGALEKMLLPFKLGIGGPLGTGNQYFPWIHLDDMVSIFIESIENESLIGPVNASAPNIVTMSQFASALGRVLSRPTLFKVPGFALSLALGESAIVVTASQRMKPAKLISNGFTWEYDSIENALKNLLH
jgi:uncharacterized protein (TIGR01777 family)